jgi:hypothetical protein
MRNALLALPTAPDPPRDARLSVLVAKLSRRWAVGRVVIALRPARIGSSPLIIAARRADQGDPPVGRERRCGAEPVPGPSAGPAAYGGRARAAP